MLLALDLGTNTGWASYDGCNILHGVQSFKNDRFCGGGMRFLKFKKWLNDLPEVTTIVFEEVRAHQSGGGKGKFRLNDFDAAHVYGGLLSILVTFAEERAIPYQGVPVGTIKKYWTSRGNANKTAMIAEAVSRDYNITDDNEADAIALLNYWINHGIFELEEK